MKAINYHSNSPVSIMHQRKLQSSLISILPPVNNACVFYANMPSQFLHALYVNYLPASIENNYCRRAFPGIDYRWG